MSHHQSRSRRLLTAVVLLVTLPPTLAHEATHAAASWPWAERLALVLDGADARLQVEWARDPPRWALVVAAYGPALAGAAMAVIGLAHLATGGVPESLRGWLVTAMLAVWWLIYTAPSALDRREGAKATD